MKENEKRIRLADGPNAILEEYCAFHGMTPSAAISPLIAAHLRHICGTPSRAGVSSSRKSNITYSEKANDKPTPSRKKRACVLPPDFSPPRSIAQDQGLDYLKALEVFKDWAVSSGRRYVDWNATFRNACKGWIPKEYPHVRATLGERYL